MTGAADDGGRLFEVICASMSAALVVLDGNQRCIQMNTAAEELTGYTLEELRGRSIHDTLQRTRPDGSHYPHSECPFERAFLQNDRQRGEEVFVHKDGRFYDVAFCASPIRDAGVIVGMVIEVEDISDRKRMETLIEAERSLLNTVLDVAPIGICVADASGRLIRMNPAMRRLWGDDAPLATSVSGYRAYRGWFEAGTDGRLVEPHEWPMSRVLAGETVVGPEIFRIEPFNAPGSRRYIALSAASVKDAAGRTIAAVAMPFDITDLIAAQADVRERDSLFRALADNIPQLAWIADASGWISWYNRRWFDYTGSTLDQMQGWGWQSVHHPDHVERITEKFRAHLASGEPFDDTFPLRRADGVFRWFLTRVFPLRDASGVIIRWFGTNTDVTEQREIEEALRRSNIELEQFAFVAAHDLQEPLRTISLFTEMLVRKLATPDPELQAYGDRISTAAQRMRTLLTDLLTYSRVVHHADGEAVAHADLNDAVAQAQQALSEAITRCGAQITSGPLPVVRGDVGQFAVVFQNLLSNALKYQPHGSVPKVSISAHQTAGRWRVIVKDNGIGFPPEHAERIFGLFKRLHGDRYPGTGLGLAICRRIVERYGGRLWAESAGDGCGSIFLIDVQSMEGE